MKSQHCLVSYFSTHQLASAFKMSKYSILRFSRQWQYILARWARMEEREALWTTLTQIQSTPQTINAVWTSAAVDFCKVQVPFYINRRKSTLAGESWLLEKAENKQHANCTLEWSLPGTSCSYFKIQLSGPLAYNCVFYMYIYSVTVYWLHSTKSNIYWLTDGLWSGRRALSHHISGSHWHSVG